MHTLGPSLVFSFENRFFAASDCFGFHCPTSRIGPYTMSWLSTRLKTTLFHHSCQSESWTLQSQPSSLAHDSARIGMTYQHFCDLLRMIGSSFKQRWFPRALTPCQLLQMFMFSCLRWASPPHPFRTTPAPNFPRSHNIRNNSLDTRMSNKRQKSWIFVYRRCTFARARSLFT